MVKITYVSPDGSEKTIKCQPGQSVMQAAIEADIDGIVGECAGNAMCATCHVYVQEPIASFLPLMQPDEDEMLQGTASAREPNSRLSCQIIVGHIVDGLVVHLPEEQ
jgi:2Fe-2S ferredoxin